MVIKKEEKVKKDEVKIKENKPAEIDVDALMNRITELERKDTDNQQKLKMLYEVSDKGRVFNYESGRAEKKPLKVKLSMMDGKVLIGWQTLRDDLLKNPTTGITMGEVQEYELLFLSSDGQQEYIKVNGYVAFSNIRYEKRIDCEVVGKREDYEGNIDFDVQLPDGRKITISSRFVN